MSAAEEQNYKEGHLCRVLGYTSNQESGEEEPYQQVYLTYDADEAERFNDVLGRFEDKDLRRRRIATLIENKFPGLQLILEQHGNEITEDLPSALPIGEGYWDEHDQVQLLYKALIATGGEKSESYQCAGFEFSSNLPTFAAAAATQSPGFLAASALGIAITGSILFRGRQQDKRYEDVLKIFVRWVNNKSRNPFEAAKILSQDIQNAGLLFSGLSKFDASNVDESYYIQDAKKRGLWYDADELPLMIAGVRYPKVGENIELELPSFQDRLSTASIIAAHFAKEQIVGFFTNPFNPKTWKNVARGVPDTFVILYELFNRTSKTQKYKEMLERNPELKSTVRIEEHEVIHETVDSHIVQQIRDSKEDFKSLKWDARAMGAAFVCETGFYGAHIYEVYHALEKMNKYHDTEGNPIGGHVHENWVDNEGLTIGFAIYSMMMASGAYAYLAGEVGELRQKLESRRAEILKLYSIAEEQYAEHKNGNEPEAAPT